MTATLQQIYDTRFVNANLQQRIIASLAKTAKAILEESSNTANHSERLYWATNFLIGGAGMSQALWLVALTNTVAETGDATTDAAIDTAVAAIVGTLSTKATVVSAVPASVTLA